MNFETIEYDGGFKVILTLPDGAIRSRSWEAHQPQAAQAREAAATLARLVRPR